MMVEEMLRIGPKPSLPFRLCLLENPLVPDGERQNAHVGFIATPMVHTPKSSVYL